MSGSIPVAFYAPLKAPDHPAPSGDRTMARLLVQALRAAGFAPAVASTLRSFAGTGDPDLQRRCKAAGEAEADRLIAAFRDAPAERRPRLWFTYHVYYKAPDWIGPRVADALGIPYAVAEGSRAPKRAEGPWALGHAGAEAALDRAEAVFVLTERDRAALRAAQPARQSLVDLPPFLEAEPWAPPSGLAEERSGPARLLTVAMIRPGDKLASFGLLACALGLIPHECWTLDIVGDGEARPEAERLFRPFGARVLFHGMAPDRAALARSYARADLFVWPAVNEAYGMALLEAQACGCPVVAGAYGGVPSVVCDGRTGVLTAPGDAAALARAVDELLGDPERRRALGAAARRFVAEERGLAQAAERLRAALMPLVAEEARSCA